MYNKGLEDKLRHKINVHIENFRADIQDEFYEQFGLYRQSLRPQHTSQWDRVSWHANSCQELLVQYSSVDQDNKYLHPDKKGVHSIHSIEGI